MEAPKIREYKQTPERIVQEKILSMMRSLGWYCLESHGNMFMRGWPDLYCTHSKYGIRWVECKLPKGSTFTPAQIETFPKLCANGTGVWVLTAATSEEYNKLWYDPNWHIHLMLTGQRSANIDRINNAHKYTAPRQHRTILKGEPTNKI